MKETVIPVISVDVPSGWDVEQGDIHSTGFNPQAVISLTAPKICMAGYKGYHYIGGRFVPPSIVEKYGLSMPDYGFNTNQVILSLGCSVISVAFDYLCGFFSLLMPYRL
jgi:hypothetical protein